MKEDHPGVKKVTLHYDNGHNRTLGDLSDQSDDGLNVIVLYGSATEGITVEGVFSDEALINLVGSLLGHRTDLLNLVVARATGCDDVHILTVEVPKPRGPVGHA